MGPLSNFVVKLTQRWTRVGSIYGSGWNEWEVLLLFYCILCLLQYDVLKKFANNGSNANAVYRQSTCYSSHLDVFIFIYLFYILFIYTYFSPLKFAFLLLNRHSLPFIFEKKIWSINVQRKGRIQYGFYNIGVCSLRRYVMGGFG